MQVRRQVQALMQGVEEAREKRGEPEKASSGVEWIAVVHSRDPCVQSRGMWHSARVTGQYKRKPCRCRAELRLAGDVDMSATTNRVTLWAVRNAVDCGDLVAHRVRDTVLSPNGVMHCVPGGTYVYEYMYQSKTRAVTL